VRDKKNSDFSTNLGYGSAIAALRQFPQLAALLGGTGVLRWGAQSAENAISDYSIFKGYYRNDDLSVKKGIEAISTIPFPGLKTMGTVAQTGMGVVGTNIDTPDPIDLISKLGLTKGSKSQKPGDESRKKVLDSLYSCFKNIETPTPINYENQMKSALECAQK
jgi:hypothetical protein